jgi:hypothetical protein
VPCRRAGERGESRGPPRCEDSVSRGLSCISVDRVNRENSGCENRRKLGDVFAYLQSCAGSLQWAASARGPRPAWAALGQFGLSFCEVLEIACMFI